MARPGDLSQAGVTPSLTPDISLDKTNPTTCPKPLTPKTSPAALPRRVAYTQETERRSAAQCSLSLAEPCSFRDQLIKANTSPAADRTVFPPRFKPQHLPRFKQCHVRRVTPDKEPHDEKEQDYCVRVVHLTHLLVLAPQEPLFGSGYDLRELSNAVGSSGSGDRDVSGPAMRS